MRRTENERNLARIALALAGLAAISVSCGPKVVVARLATPTAEVSRAAATPTPPTKRQPPAPSPVPAAAAPTAPRLTATGRPPSISTPRSTPTPTSTPTPSPTPTLTATATPTPRVVATEVPPARASSPAAPASPPRPSPSASATRTPVRPSPLPVATAIPARVPPTSSPAPRVAPTATPVPAPLAAPAAAPPFVTPQTAASWIGEWDFRADTGQGVLAGTLRFRTAAAGIAGTYVGLRGNTTELSNVTTAGGRISFDLVTPRAVWHLEGSLSGDHVQGTFRTAERTIPWSADRKAAAPALTPARTPP